MKPLRNLIHIQCYEWPEKTKGGIYFPETIQYDPKKGGKDPWRGKILAIGDEVEEVKVNDMVRYHPDNYCYRTVQELGDKTRYIVIEDSLIFAVEDEDEKIIKALKGRVIVEPKENLDAKIGILYLPQQREQDLIYGSVIAAGSDTELNVGDSIIMENKKTWQYYDAAGGRYLMVDVSSILASIGE